ncbi:MAG: hypothetical protein QG594_1635 [Bacteroidota bacterium]|nr:hypothetical protein [Bacteroidota bacterium]
MKKIILTSLFLLLNFTSFSQNLIYKNKGNITDSNGKKLSTEEVRTLLANNETLLEEYNIGRDKKTFGNILLVGGATLAYGLTAVQLYNGTPVSIGLFAVGTLSMLVAIPVKIGFTKKIKHVVAEYNNQKAIGVNNFKVEHLDIIANSNGLGIKLTLD